MAGSPGSEALRMEVTGMADVIIKDMEMPENCWICLMFIEDDYSCQLDGRGVWENVNNRPDWCPLGPAPEWISVEERLPDPYKVVIVAYLDTNDPIGNCYIGMTSWTGVTNHGEAHWNYYGPAIKITHWMQLPSQPEVTPHD